MYRLICVLPDMGRMPAACNCGHSAEKAVRAFPPGRFFCQASPGRWQARTLEKHIDVVSKKRLARVSIVNSHSKIRAPLLCVTSTHGGDYSDVSFCGAELTRWTLDDHKRGA